MAARDRLGEGKFHHEDHEDHEGKTLKVNGPILLILPIPVNNPHPFDESQSTQHSPPILPILFIPVEISLPFDERLRQWRTGSHHTDGVDVD